MSYNITTCWESKPGFHVNPIDLVEKFCLSVGDLNNLLDDDEVEHASDERERIDQMARNCKG